MLAEQAGRYKEMVEFLENEFRQRKKDFNSDERNLLAISYKNFISSDRSSLRTILAYESKERKKESSSYLPYIIEYKAEVANKLTKKCQRIIKFIKEVALIKAKEDESIVFYITKIGDNNRFMGEIAEGDLKKQVCNNALKAYEEAIEKAKKLGVLNPIRLGLYLNFSVFYYDLLNDHDKAIDIAKKVVLEVEKELPNIDEDADENRGTVSIFEKLKENLDIWVSEEEEKRNI